MPTAPIDYAWLKHYPEGIEWELNEAPKPLYSILDESAQRWPSQLCVDFLGKQYTYARIEEMVNRVATGLQANGVGRETRVGLFMPNSPQYIIAYFAILKAGGTVVNFNPLYSPREVEHQIVDSKVEIMFTLNLKTLYPKLKPMIGKGSLRKVVVGFFQEALPMTKAALFTVAKATELVMTPKDQHHITFNELLSHEPKPKPVPILPTEHVAVLQYTGGTTGVPKGTVLTHANLYYNVVQCSRWMQGLKAGEETMLAVLPFFHVFAMTVALNLAIHHGMRILPHPRFDLKKVLEDIDNKKPTLLPGVSTLYATINNYKHIDRYDLSSIKWCISGGGPLPVDVQKKFIELTGCKLAEGYGLTESSPVVTCNPLDPAKRKIGTIGLPLPGTILEIVDKEDRTTLLGPGEIGEICIRGPQVMKAYLNQPAETGEVLRNGRLHTGDLGFMDEQGYFTVVDRLKEMIIVGGYNVYPRNVEEVIYTHPSVAEAAVVGLDHSRRGQMIKAYIVLKEKATLGADELKDYLRQRMSAYAVPHEIEFREILPKSMIGKILKKELIAEEKLRQKADAAPEHSGETKS